MAFLALGIGAALLAPSGTVGATAVAWSTVFFAAGATAGGIIDQMYTYPALFGTGGQDQKGPRLDDVPAQTSSEGSPRIQCYGPQNRVAGTVIWQSSFKETEQEDDVGGGKGGGGGSTVTTYTYSVSLAIAVCKGPISGITKIMADTTVIYDADSGIQDDRYDDLTIYPGTTTQVKDPIIVSFEGDIQTPAYRGTAYVVIENFQLQDFGNRLPQFSFIVKESETATVADVLGKIMAQAKVPSGYYDTSAMTDNVRGYYFTGVQQPVSVMEPVMGPSFGLGQDRGDKIVFLRRSDTSPLVIPDEDLGSFEEGDSGRSDGSEVWKITDVPDYKLPSRVEVRYTEPLCDLLSGSQSEIKPGAEHSNVVSINAPLTMTGDEAKTYARRTVWAGWAERLTVKFSLPPQYINLLEGDLVTVKGRNWRLSGIDRGYNMVLECTGVSEESHVLTQTAIADGVVNCTADGLSEVPPAACCLMDIAPLRDQDAQTRGFYVAECLASPSRWRGINLYRSGHPDTGFQPIYYDTVKANVGISVTTLAPGPIGYWDWVNTVDIQMYHGFLSSATEDDVLAGSNRAWLAGELIGFQTATLVSTNRWRLSGLLRGLRDTDGSIWTHTDNDLFCLLNKKIRFVPYESRFHNTNRYYKAVPVGGSIDATDYQRFHLTSNSLRPLRPGQVTIVRATNNDVTLNWVRRSRGQFSILDLANGAPLLEPTETYDVDYLVGEVVKRTKRGSATTSSYLHTEQTADGVTPGTALTVRVYEINTLIGGKGRGRYTEVTI